MFETISIITGLAGIISHIAADFIMEKGISPFIKKKKLKKELSNITENAIKKTAKGKFADYFTLTKGMIDDSFWKHETVKKELWGTLTDLNNIDSIPDFNKLYKVYHDEIFMEGHIERQPFEDVIDKFWVNFLKEAEKSTILQQVFEKNKISCQLNESVYPSEGLEMIREYCQNSIKTLEEKLFNAFRPKWLDKTAFSKDEIKKQFFDYKRTEMAYISIGEKGYETDSIIESDEYLKEDKLIIVGDGGIGKTRFLKELEKRLVNEIALTEGKPAYLPVYLEAKEIKTEDFSKLFKTKIKEGLPVQKYTEAKIKGFIRYLNVYNKLFPLIDAFDQVSGESDGICKIIASDVLFGKCKCFITTRRYVRGTLTDGIKKHGMDERLFRIAELRYFKIEELKDYFKNYYPKIKSVIDKLQPGSNEGINLIQIPMFAELVKVMVMTNRLDPDSITKNNRAWMLKRFIRFIIIEQCKKDKDPGGIKASYEMMLQKIEHLSLELLKMNNKQIGGFFKHDAINILGDDYEKYWQFMIKAQFIYFFDYEGIESLEEKYQRYHHQIFQEYFAARRLYHFRSHDMQSMRSAMEKMEYMPEIGRFLGEIVEIEKEEKDIEREFKVWMNLLLAENQENWVRTYALQVRDKLGENKTENSLKNMFKKENEELRSKAIETIDNMITIPAGRFLRGSYEYLNEWPVRWVELDDYCIDKYPVTNEYFIDFLRNYYKENKKLKDVKGNILIDFEWSRIRDSENGFFKIEKGYEKNPVAGITWYGAMEYCNWKSSKDKRYKYRLPTEAEWENAARGMYGRRYPWGNEFDIKKCNTDESGNAGTTEVEKYKEYGSPYGCCDMAGNVWEWCMDYYKGDYYKESPEKNPECTEKGEYRTKVLRGGSWGGDRVFARCADRVRFNPDDRSGSVGFRCARTITL